MCCSVVREMKGLGYVICWSANWKIGVFSLLKYDVEYERKYGVSYLMECDVEDEEIWVCNLF